MEFLLISKYGEGCGVAKRIAEEGNKVWVQIQDKHYADCYDGMIEKIENPTISKEEIVFFDMSGLGKEADALRSKGHYVFGASEFHDKLEHDRKFGLDVMRRCGIKVPLTEEFVDFSLAKSFVEEHDKRRFVFKPEGKNLPCNLTYVSEDADDLSAFLQFVEEKYAKQIRKFVLQEFIEGALVSTEAFCDGNQFVGPFSHTVESKKFMDKDLGPATGCSGNLVWLPEAPTRVLLEGVSLAEDICVANDFVGQLDLNAVVNDAGVWGLEWTPRFGYDATPTLMHMFDGEVGKFISDIARGQASVDASPLGNMAQFGAAVRISIPPYPAEPEGDSDRLTPNLDVPIRNYESYLQNLYFYQVKRNAEGDLVHSRGPGLIGCAIAVGDYPDECFDECYEVAGAIKIPDKQYRSDLSEVLLKMYNDVKEVIHANA